nr:MAG TPA: hypothetical protein [Caudoviricetes sp.]
MIQSVFQTRIQRCYQTKHLGFSQYKLVPSEPENNPIARNNNWGTIDQIIIADTTVPSSMPHLWREGQIIISDNTTPAATATADIRVVHNTIYAIGHDAYLMVHDHITAPGKIFRIECPMIDEILGGAS